MTHQGLRRWTLLVALASAIAALVLPTSASALTAAEMYPDPCRVTDAYGYACDTRIESLATYKGWAHVDPGLYCGGAYPPEELPAQLNSPLSAWRWSGSAWSRTPVARGTQVYVWPYATGWSWVWTQRTGWLAMQDQHLVINPRFQCWNRGGPMPLAAP